MLSRAVVLGAGLEATVLLARAYIGVQQYPAAETVLRGALKRNPGNLQLNYLLAVTLDKMGRKQEALRLYTSMLKGMKSLGSKATEQLTSVQKMCEASVQRLQQELGTKNDKNSKTSHKKKKQ